MKTENRPPDPQTLSVPEGYKNCASSWQPYADIHAERRRAYNKHIENGNTVEQLPSLSHEWLPIVIEEIGEVAHVLNDDEFSYGVIGYDSIGRRMELRKELVQVAAMVAAWIDTIDYELKFGNYRP
jgi:hypothetical protein